MDYALGAAALAAPNILGFSKNAAPTWLSRGIGLYALTSALTTKNGGGLLKALPYNTHLSMDTAGGLLSLASPWLLGFASNKRAMKTILTLAAIQTVVRMLSRKGN